MKRILLFFIAVAISAFFSACQPPAANTTANTANSANTANANAAKPTAAAPTKESLMTMEKAGWEAWKNRDAKWTEENYSEKAMNISGTGRSDKAAAIKSYSEQKCEIKSYSLSDDQMQMVGPDVAVLTFRGTQDYVCDGKKGPSDVHAASIYVREGDKWKAAFYAETPVVDPKAAPKPPTVVKKEEPAATEAKPDALTEALLTVEKRSWEGWKNKDAKALEEDLSKDFVFVSGMGRMDHAATIKAWTTENKCEVKSYWLSDAKSAPLSNTVSLMTFKGGGEGTCEGQPLTTDWYGVLYIKEGEAWRLAFGMGVPTA